MDFEIYRAKQHKLLKGCLRGERSAQQQLFDLYSAKMYGLCYRYVRRPMEAEDILVTGFTKIFERIHQFKGEGSLEGWIRRIMVNEALGHLRRSRNMYLETDIGQAHGTPDYDSLGGLLEAQDLLNMIQDLPAGYRVVFNMYAIDGYSHKEIAEALGISESTSKSQLSRARAYLQKLLAENDSLTKRKISGNERAT